jgi:hypothetical protein
MNQRVCKDNCLATKFPEIATEWHPTKNDDLTPYDVTAGSHKKVWWQDKKGHEWETDIKSRTSFLKRGCPYCTNRKACKDNCLATKFPEIAAEWHYTKNDTTPKNVLPGCGKKYWFQCKKGHEWKATINSRTSCKCGCPICNESKGEKKTAEILLSLNIKFKRQWRFKSCKYKNPLPFDFVIKTKNGIKTIEYQGEQHYIPIWKIKRKSYCHSKKRCNKTKMVRRKKYPIIKNSILGI